MDKTDIITLARKIGTYDISIKKDTGCGAVPVHPEVRAHYAIAFEEDKKLNIDRMISESLERAKVRLLAE
jgi:thiamine biosynthesis protein ThiI